VKELPENDDIGWIYVSGEKGRKKSGILERKGGRNSGEKGRQNLCDRDRGK